MEDLNNKLAGLRDTVKKIKNEIKSFEENESKNSEQRRINTVANKIFRPSSYSKEIPMNKLNKTILKNYFKFPSKEQNLFSNTINNKSTIRNNNKASNNKYKYKTIMTPQNLGKNIQMNRISKKFNKRINSKIISCNGNNNDEKNIKSLGLSDLNNMINHLTIDNESNSRMNKNLFKHIASKQKEYYSRQKSGLNENKIDEIDRIIMTYSNADHLKKNIFNDYFYYSKNKNPYNKKYMLYNEYNNFNAPNGKDNKNINKSAHLSAQRTSINKNLDIKDLISSNNDKENQTSNIKMHNNNLFQFNGSKLSNKNNSKKNNSYNGKFKVIPNCNKIINIKKSIKDNKNLSKKDTIPNSSRTFIPNNEFFLCDKELLDRHKNFNETYQNFNFSIRPTIYIPNNNTINYLSNDSGEDFDLNKNGNAINKYKIRKILGKSSIGDIYLKAKLFEKCGENNFKNYVYKYCDTNNSISNLKKYKKFLEHLKKEESQDKKLINIYQKLCKKIIELMNPQEINEIVDEIQNNFIENKNDNYIIDQLKSILPY